MSGDGPLTLTRDADGEFLLPAELLAGRDRTLAGPTAPPDGLVFVGPLYPHRWGLPAAVSLADGDDRET